MPILAEHSAIPSHPEYNPNREESGTSSIRASACRIAPNAKSRTLRSPVVAATSDKNKAMPAVPSYNIGPSIWCAL